MSLRALITALALLFPAPSFAAIDLVPTEVRSWSVPTGFDIENALVASSDDGTTFVAAQALEAENAYCAILVATTDRAFELAYTFDARPTTCLGIVPHPDGGVIVRGTDPTAQPGTPAGFTTYLSDDGNELWKLSDRALTDAAAGPAGPGTYLGAYKTPLSPIAFSPARGRVVVFTAGSITIDRNEKLVSEAHVIDAATGQLTRNGQTFGAGGTGTIARIIARDSGDFLLHYTLNDGLGSLFYTYDGDISVRAFEPAGKDWSDRKVGAIAHERSTNHLAWTPSDAEDAPTFLTITNDAGDLFLEQEYPGAQLLATGEELLLGPPTGLWITPDFAAIEHATLGPRLVHIVDPEAEARGVAYLDDATPYRPLALTRSAEHTLRLITYDMVERRVREHDLAVEDVDPFDPDAGYPDVGISLDLGTDVAVKLLDDYGCSCSSLHRSTSTPMPAALLGLLGLLALSFRRR